MPQFSQFSHWENKIHYDGIQTNSSNKTRESRHAIIGGSLRLFHHFRGWAKLKVTKNILQTLQPATPSPSKQATQRTTF